MSLRKPPTEKQVEERREQNRNLNRRILDELEKPDTEELKVESLTEKPQVQQGTGPVVQKPAKQVPPLNPPSSARSDTSSPRETRYSTRSSSSGGGGRSPRDGWTPHAVKRAKLRKNETQLLGAGAFGQVYMGLNESSGELIAVKEIQFRDFASQELKEMVAALAREIQLMKKLKHPNIVKYIGADRIDNSLLIYMEYVPGGSLAGLVKKFGKLGETTVRKYIHQILCGLSYLHSMNIVHRDIKGDNALLDVTGEVKLADFGTSKEMEDCLAMDKLHTVTGTPWFMAPEVIKGAGHGRPADIWSVGATAIELLTGKPPYSNIKNPQAAMYQIASSDAEPEYPPGISDSCLSFLKSCFIRDPSDRASVDELLQSDFIFGVDASSDSDGNAPTPKAGGASSPSRNSHHTSQQSTGPSSEAWKDKGNASSKNHPKHPTNGSVSASSHKTSTKDKKLNKLMPAKVDANAEPQTDTGPVLKSERKRITAHIKGKVQADMATTTISTNQMADLEYLEKLAGLQKKGIISEQEFESKKAQILWGNSME